MGTQNKFLKTNILKNPRFGLKNKMSKFSDGILCLFRRHRQVKKTVARASHFYGDSYADC